jgi:putative nucleotidyltransferase with HDIG domain
MRLVSTEESREPALALALAAARAVARTPGLALPQRRRAFLAHLAPHLGPAQWAHVSDHCDRVAETVRDLARLLRWDDALLTLATHGALLHDLGKCAIPESILAKPGPLDPHERETIDHHGEIGARLAREMGLREDVQRVIAHHHTRYDDESVSIASPAPVVQAARLVCLGDALVAMTSDRPYSRARTYSDALAELRLHRGKQFDPAAVTAAHIYASARMAA